jgi:hypothetical protein
MRGRSALSGLICAAGLAAAPASAIAAASPAVNCTFTKPTESVDAYARVPAAIHAVLGTMAERDQPFQVTDVILPGPQNPSKRLISAGRRGNKWFVLYEQGGAAYSWHVAAFAIQPTGLRVLVRGIAPVQWVNDRWVPKTDVCQGIDQVLGS